MKQNKLNSKMKYILKIFLPFVFFTTFLAADKIVEFDPASVMSKDCKNGKLNCGYIPASREETKTIPESSSNFIRHRGLPSRYDLSSKMPPIGNQGSQGSCVGWATTYAVKSYNMKKKYGWNYDITWKRVKVKIPNRPGWYTWKYVGEGSKNHIFSPAFTYNQINGGRDRGSVISYATRLLVQKGATPWSYMPYDDKNYLRQPSAKAKAKARTYRSLRFARLSFSSPEPIKAVISQGHPVIVGIKVYQNFHKLGSKVYDTFSGRSNGGHAIALVGYDDNKRSSNGHKGAFKIFNSWGRNWGNKGYGWISYKHLARANHTAIVLYETEGSNPSVDDKKDDKIVVKIKAPRAVTASKGTYSNKIVVAWSKVRGALSYKIERKNPYASSYYRVAFSNTTQYVDTNITVGGAYKYRIVAVGEKKSSKAYNSPIAEGYSQKSKQKSLPSKVANLSSEVISGRSVKLSWAQSTDTKYYEVQRWDVKRYRWSSLSSYNRSTYYTDRRPFSGKLNYYRVRAKNYNGKGSFSSTVTAKIGGRQTPPSKVAGLKATIGTLKGKIQVNWQRIANATSYYVYRYDYSRRKWDKSIKVRRNSFTDNASKIGNGKWYAYTVIASNKYGYSGFSKSVYGRAKSYSQRGASLDAPKNLKATVNQKAKTITLKWKKVKKAETYNIFRKTEKGSFRFIKSVSKTQFTTKIKEEEKLYFYAVRAKSMFGESKNSNLVAGFINSTMPGMKERFVPGDGIRNFTGTWSALHWDNKFKRPTKIVLKITSKDNHFNISMKVGNRRAKRIKGLYASKSNYLKVPGFIMKIPMKVEDVADVEVSKKYSRYGFMSTFIRDSK